jgi:uncharacterized phage protein gp47/JayE
MPLFAESSEKILGDLLVEIIDDTNLTKVSIGSKTRAVASALAAKLGSMYRKFDINFIQAFLVGAEGQYLDFIGNMMGVERLGQVSSQVASSERNVKFYVEFGTFGDINGGASILLTSGTTVSTGPTGSGIVYTVPYDVILSSTASETYVAARAVRAGSVGNLGARQLIHHDFINYSDIANATLKVTNEAEIIRGLDGEIDTNYRFRISQQVTAAEAANLTSIRLATLNTPGIADVIVLPFHRGIGTYDLLLKSVTPTLPGGLIPAVVESVSKVTAQGIVPNVRGPVEVGLSLTGTLVFKKQLSAREETNIISAVVANVIDYVNGLDIGEDFIINEAIERVMSTSDQIKNIGSATRPFDSVYVYRPSKLEDNKVRNTLIGDYTAEVDERVIVENRYAGATPILFRTIV